MEKSTKADGEGPLWQLRSSNQMIKIILNHLKKSATQWKNLGIQI